MSFGSTVCFVACHGGPADHFATFAENLTQKGYKVEMYATGPAFKKLQDRNVEHVTSFSLDAPVDILADRCSHAAVIITDVGHTFDIALQEALQVQAPNSLRYAYYDNLEAFVPGGYSVVAAQVMRAAQGVLFANTYLVEELASASEKRIGIGYYPIAQAEKIAQRRTSEHSQMRDAFFSKYSLMDEGQKILVYAGGNNSEYFSNAFPAFLQIIKDASLQRDLSQFVVLLQQHPGAKETNIDGQLVGCWLEEQGQEAKLPKFFMSEMSSDDSQVVADAMLYYQTSMGPQFVLAGIPRIQVGHKIYEDILVKKGLCFSATDATSFMSALSSVDRVVRTTAGDKKTIKEGAGILPDWDSRLEAAIGPSYNNDFVQMLCNTFNVLEREELPFKKIAYFFKILQSSQDFTFDDADERLSNLLILSATLYSIKKGERICYISPTYYYAQQAAVMRINYLRALGASEDANFPTVVPGIAGYEQCVRDSKVVFMHGKDFSDQLPQGWSGRKIIQTFPNEKVPVDPTRHRYYGPDD